MCVVYYNVGKTMIINTTYHIVLTSTRYTPLQLQPGQCGSIITEDFTLQGDILDCDCKAFGYALKVDGQGIILNLNGYTVECKLENEFSFRAHILVDGTANNVLGPGTGEWYIDERWLFHY